MRLRDWLLRQLVPGLLAAAMVLLATLFVAGEIIETRLVRQGRYAAVLLAEDSLTLTGVVSDPKKLDATLKFLGAVTAAYINFELIPVNEARTFTVIFEALDDAITVDRFVYRGKTLIITGHAPDAKTGEAFRRRLEAQDYLVTVDYHAYTTVSDNVRFQVTCGLQ
jgi:Tfp pilus assembly protein PilN